MPFRWSSKDVKAPIRAVGSVAELIAQLRALPAPEIARLQRKGSSVRPFFQYRHGNAAERRAKVQLAPDLIIEAICARALSNPLSSM